MRFSLRICDGRARPSNLTRTGGGVVIVSYKDLRAAFLQIAQSKFYRIEPDHSMDIEIPGHPHRLQRPC